MSAHYHLGTGHLGGLRLHIRDYPRSIARYPDFPQDPIDNELTDLELWELPIWKANASATWSMGPLSTTVYAKVIGGLPNYAATGRLPTTATYNGSLSYRLSSHAQIRLTVDNLFDQQPQRDPTWTAWPYYSRNWFSRWDGISI